MQTKKYCPFCGARLGKKFWEGSLRLFCEPCGEAVYENPVPATCLVVVDPTDRVLLVKRNVPPKAGFWCLPGGFMELGETPEAAALRELKEETGLSGKVEMLLGVLSNPSSDYHTVLMIGYLVKQVSGTPKPGDDASDISYFHFAHLPELAFDSHIQFIRIYFSAYSADNK